MGISQKYGFLALMIALVLMGCGGRDEDEHNEHGEHSEHGHDEAGVTAAVPQSYAQAVARCEALSEDIAGLIASGELHEVHAKASEIQKVARKLPELARDELPAGMLRDINIKSKELAGLFGAIDKSADSGDKGGTIEVHERMKTLIGELEVHAELVHNGDAEENHRGDEPDEDHGHDESHEDHDE